MPLVPIGRSWSSFLDCKRIDCRASRRSTKWIVIWFASGSARGEARGKTGIRSEETSFMRLLYLRLISLETLASTPRFLLPFSRLISKMYCRLSWFPSCLVLLIFLNYPSYRLYWKQQLGISLVFQIIIHGTFRLQQWLLSIWYELISVSFYLYSRNVKKILYKTIFLSICVIKTWKKKTSCIFMRFIMQLFFRA